MPTHTLLILETAYQRVGRQIEEIAPDAHILTMDDAGKFVLDGNAGAESDIAPTLAWMGLDLYRCPESETFTQRIAESDRLRWVQTALAGVEAPIYQRLMEKGVRLCNSDAQAPSVADFVVGSVIAHLQRYAHRRELQAAKQWQPYEFRELGRTTWLILGYGSIGQEVAKRVSGFGAKVTGIRRNPQPDAWATVTRPDALPELLPNSDVVVLACSLTDATQAMVNAAFLRQMQAHSILVNIGRGALIVDADLLEALDAGHIEHAVLDVFDPEPLPAAHRYWSHPNVLVASHCSAFGDGMADRGDALFLNNLQRFLTDAPLHKEVHTIS